MKIKANQDIYYSTTADTLTYYIENKGNMIFKGKAYKNPDAANCNINVTKICRDWVKNTLPYFRNVANSAITQEEAYQEFKLYTYSATTVEGEEVLVPVLLETYNILFDYDYELPWNGGSKILSNPINGRMDSRMKLMYSVYKANTGETICYQLEVTPIINISPSYIQVVNGGATTYINVSSNTEYYVSSNQSWITVNPTSGEAGTNVITVVINENTVVSSRTGNILIGDKVCRIVQNAAPEIVNIYPNSYSANENSGTTSFTVVSNTKYNVIPQSNWISVSPSRGNSGTTLITVNYGANTQTTERTGTIKIKDKEFILTQEALTYITIASDTTSIPFIGGLYPISVSSNTTWDFELIFPAEPPTPPTPTGSTITVSPNSLWVEDTSGTTAITVISSVNFSISSSDSWITFSPSAGNSGITTINVSYGANSSDYGRTGILRINNKIYYINQKGNSESALRKINYTSNVLCQPYSSGIRVFGANIVSNTFNEGNGTIKFDGIVTSIGESAFKGTGLKGITIPEAVLKIQSEAFYWCRYITSVVIPETVTEIQYRAFSGCIALNNITYQGTMAQWQSITLEAEWNNNVPAEVVHCTDGDITL